MKFGIFYEHQLPRPWAADSEHRLIQNALDQIELADRLGYDYAWEVEHHFLEEYSHSSAPEVFLAAASQRTKSIQLASLSGSQPSTWSRAVGSKWASAKAEVLLNSIPSTAASAISVKYGKRPCAALFRCLPKPRGSSMATSSIFLLVTYYQNRSRSHIRRCGSHVARSKPSRWLGSAAW